MKRSLWLAVTSLSAAGLIVGCSSETTGGTSPSTSNTSTSMAAAVPAQGGLKNQFDGRSIEGEQVVGSQIAPGTYRVTGYDCTYLVRQTVGGKVLTGVTMNGDGDANVSLDVTGSTVEMTSGCAWRLIEAAS